MSFLTPALIRLIMMTHHICIPCVSVNDSDTENNNSDPQLDEKLTTNSPTYTPYSDLDPETDKEAATFVHDLLTNPTTPSPSPSTLRQRPKNKYTQEFWKESLAAAILTRLESALQKGVELSGTVKETVQKAIEAADIAGFIKEHPIYCTVIAIGVLFLLAPWVLEVLGFEALGPVEGSWAAVWQSRYLGYIPKGSWFSFFQRLSMLGGI